MTPSTGDKPKPSSNQFSTLTTRVPGTLFHRHAPSRGNHWWCSFFLGHFFKIRALQYNNTGPTSNISKAMDFSLITIWLSIWSVVMGSKLWSICINSLQWADDYNWRQYPSICRPQKSTAKEGLSEVWIAAGLFMRKQAKSRGGHSWTSTRDIPCPFSGWVVIFKAVRFNHQRLSIRSWAWQFHIGLGHPILS